MCACIDKCCMLLYKDELIFRGYCQRVRYRLRRAELLEEAKNRDLLESYAQLVIAHKNGLQPFAISNYFKGSII